MLYVCPFCMYQRSWFLRRNKRKCKKCRREFSAKQYPVDGIRLTRKEWKECLEVFLAERTIHALIRETSLGYNSAVKVAHRIRTTMILDVPSPFSGICEMDETYIGGQRKNKRLHIRRIQGKRGHGTDKLPIVGIYGREAKQIYVEVIPKLNMPRITDVITKRVILGSPIYTDGYKMYRSLPKRGHPHKYVNHHKGEYVRGDIHTNNIEGFWSILKRKLSCIGGMRRDRLPLFVAEIVWKFNYRDLTRREQYERLFHHMTGVDIGGRK